MSDKVIYTAPITRSSNVAPTQSTGTFFGPSTPGYGNQPHNVITGDLGDFDSVELQNIERFVLDLARSTALIEVPNVVPVGSTITLPSVPGSDAKIYFTRNGLRMKPTTDYTRTGAVITLVIPPFGSDIFYITFSN